MEWRDKWKAKKEDTQQINACCTGPLPAFVEDVDDEDDGPEPDPESTPEEQLEEGNRIWATRLLPEPEHIQASSTISQRLTKVFKRNSKPADYERHIPPHLHDFQSVFFKDFSEHAQPLFDLTQNDVKWHWGMDEQLVFDMGQASAHAWAKPVGG
jgi:hypothetical protein